MEVRIEFLAPKKLIGQGLRMSLSDNLTYRLWSQFMPRRKEILNPVSTELISMQVYDAGFDIRHFKPDTQFEKWAAVEVAALDRIPEGMEAFTLPGGLYAVFIHKGDSAAFNATFQHIFQVWLPDSDYVLDDRPHFEVLGDKYKREDAESEEEVWVPVRRKS